MSIKGKSFQHKVSHSLQKKDPKSQLSFCEKTIIIFPTKKQLFFVPIFEIFNSPVTYVNSKVR
jgi:hypothetical protein